MALHLTYATKTYRPPNAVVPGNADAMAPVEFDLTPAEGADLARIKSILIGTAGLVADMPWTADAQQIVVSSFQHGAPAFVATVKAVRGLTVPAEMALRVGLVLEKDVPAHVVTPGAAPVPNLQAPIPVRTGFEFSRICGFVSSLAMVVANEIVQLSNETGIDPRFFAPPSGSGGQATPATTSGNATSVPPPPDGSATAASGTSPAA
jgi:hypothetical protein